MIRYCGNCNPDVDPSLTTKAVKALYGDAVEDTLLVVSGCSRACLLRSAPLKALKDKIAVSAREAVDLWQTKAEGKRGGEEI